jgi:hypothetical protein
MSLVSMTFRGVMLHRDIGWPEHSMALVIVRHDTRQFMASLMGYAASAAVLGTFLMRRMVPLRMLAILSNVLFVAYGYAEQIYPVLCLHIALLPINVQSLLTSMARLEQAPGLPLRPIRPIALLRRHAFLFVLGLLSGTAGGWFLMRILSALHA